MADPIPQLPKLGIFPGGVIVIEVVGDPNTRVTSTTPGAVVIVKN